MLEELDFSASLEVNDDQDSTRNDVQDGEEDQETSSEAPKQKRTLVSLLQSEEDDANDLWQKEGLEDGELEGLLADARTGSSADDGLLLSSGKVKNRRRGRAKTSRALPSTQTKGGYMPLTEPSFFSSSFVQAPSHSPTYEDDDIIGDPTSLAAADASDKEKRKRSLRFHTSKIAATSARRSAARTQRLGGDEDLPYRDRKAARNAALRKSGPQGQGGEALESVGDRKRVRDIVPDDEGIAAEEDGVGYYELVKRRRTEEKAEAEADHKALQIERL